MRAIYLKMEIGRKAFYVIILSGNYTAMIFISMTSGYADIMLTMIGISVLAYGILLYSLRLYRPQIEVGFSDVMINIFVYSFVNFSIMFMTLLSATVQFTASIFGLMMLPVIIWSMIWLDLYLSRGKRLGMYFVKAGDK